MEPQRDVVREATPAPPQWHRLLRGLLWGVGALGLIALGALGAILGPRYLGDVLHIPAATAPTSLPARRPRLSQRRRVRQRPRPMIVLSPEAVSRGRNHEQHRRRWSRIPGGHSASPDGAG